MKHIIILLLLIFSTISLAQVDSVRVTWTDPTSENAVMLYVYGDLTENATTLRDSIDLAEEVWYWQPPEEGLWYFRMRSRTAGYAYSAYSNEDTVTITTISEALPDAPTGFEAEGGTSDTEIPMTWTDAVGDIDSVRIYEGSTNDTTAMTWIASVVQGAETYTRTGRTAETTYWYAVKSYDGTNESYFSNTDSATTTEAGGEEMEVTRYKSELSLADSQVTNINNLVVMLKDSLAIDSLPQAFDVIYLFKNENSTSAYRNLVKRDHDATAPRNEMTFDAWNGVMSDRDTYENAELCGYLNTNYNPAEDGVAYTLNSASVGMYVGLGGDTAATAARLFFITDVTANGVQNILTPCRPEYIISTRLNDDAEYAPDNPNAVGFYSSVRTGSTERSVYKNGVELGSGSTATSIAVPDLDFYLFKQNDNGTVSAVGGASPHMLEIFFVGKGFDATENRKIYNCFQAYLDSIGD